MSHPVQKHPVPAPAPVEEATPASASALHRRHLSLDTWAVVLALVMAALVKLHILNSVKW